MKFLTLRTEAFGLDISNSSLKIVKLKESGNFYKLASFGETPLEPGIIQEGEVHNQEKLTQTIKQVVKEVSGEKIKTKYFVASLPEEKAFLQVIQMPKIASEDLKSAIIYEAENYIPLPIAQVYLDFQIVRPTSNNLDHFDVLIAAFPKKIIDSYILCFKRAGLMPQVLEIESQAIARALVKGEISRQPLLLINFALNKTELIIFSGSSIRFTSSFPINSQQSTELAFQIKKYLDFYQTHASHEHLPPDGKGVVEKIIICGEGENLKELPYFFSKELKIEAELGKPWVNVLADSKKEPPNFSLEKSLSFTTVLGLALMGMKEQ